CRIRPALTFAVSAEAVSAHQLALPIRPRPPGLPRLRRLPGLRLTERIGAHRVGSAARPEAGAESWWHRHARRLRWVHGAGHPRRVDRPAPLIAEAVALGPTHLLLAPPHLLLAAAYLVLASAHLLLGPAEFGLDPLALALEPLEVGLLAAPVGFEALLGGAVPDQVATLAGTGAILCGRSRRGRRRQAL